MPYTGIDHFIARMRFRAAYPHIRQGSRVCDLGCGFEAAFLDYASDRIGVGVGLDDQVADGTQGRWQRVRGDLRSPLPFPDGHFDHVVMLAVFEHLTEPEKVLTEAYRVIAAARFADSDVAVGDGGSDSKHAARAASDQR